MLVQYWTTLFDYYISGHLVCSLASQECQLEGSRRPSEKVPLRYILDHMLPLSFSSWFSFWLSHNMYYLFTFKFLYFQTFLCRFKEEDVFRAEEHRCRSSLDILSVKNFLYSYLKSPCNSCNVTMDFQIYNTAVYMSTDNFHPNLSRQTDVQIVKSHFEFI